MLPDNIEELIKRIWSKSKGNFVFLSTAPGGAMQAYGGVLNAVLKMKLNKYIAKADYEQVKIEFNNRASLQFIASVNQLSGMRLDGVVIYSQTLLNERVVTQLIDPTLVDRQGWKWSWRAW